MPKVPKITMYITAITNKSIAQTNRQKRHPIILNNELMICIFAPFFGVIENFSILNLKIK
ncbi:hypothetical protein LMG8286_01706 [Campylobacter suis]|uniref:Uncharacterized protein n=1 Tax=Campylobacter suis TaxID=2790657 RepID=A0ABN7KAZ0_9BACT|nr:hypothetical protein LMG8286_01706 [Campylobacter suis]